MPFDFSVDHDRRRVTIVAHDPLSVDDVLATLDRQAAQAWSYAVLHDARATTWVPNASEVIRVLNYVRNTARRLSQSRGAVAIVAPQQGLFGMARMYSIYGKNDYALQVEVFNDIEAAERWLDSR